MEDRLCPNFHTILMDHAHFPGPIGVADRATAFAPTHLALAERCISIFRS